LRVPEIRPRVFAEGFHGGVIVNYGSFHGIGKISEVVFLAVDLDGSFQVSPVVKHP